MSSMRLLKGNWQASLADVVNSATKELLISSPFVTQEGVDFILANLRSNFKYEGELIFVTNLSPINLIQGSTDPNSLRKFTQQLSAVRIHHVSRLHAKTYISDARKAIITSGNLTGGGLRLNYEYGILLEESEASNEAHTDILDYANLGARIGNVELNQYCLAADEAKKAYQKQQNSITQTAKRYFEETLQAANDELIRFQLADGAIHTVFEKTILYLLRKHHELSTEEIHPLVKGIHPDLCDDSVDRVIGGRHFGKKWKHAVRTAQQHLRKKGIIELGRNGKWSLL
jgi:hypothetical protein